MLSSSSQQISNLGQNFHLQIPNSHFLKIFPELDHDVNFGSFTCDWKTWDCYSTSMFRLCYFSTQLTDKQPISALLVLLPSQNSLGRIKVEYQIRVLSSMFCESSTSILSKLNKLIWQNPIHHAYYSVTSSGSDRLHAQMQDILPPLIPSRCTNSIQWSNMSRAKILC